MTRVESRRWDLPAGRVGGADWIVLALFLAVMAVFSYMRARHRMFWGDELMGWLVMREPHFAGMMHEWWAGLDSGSLYFMVGGRFWMQIFGASELALRMFSATMTAVSFVIFWVAVRRYYSLAIVSVCLPLVYLGHSTLSWQFYNGRMYGGFLAASAFALYAFFRSDPARPLTGRVMALTFAAHLALIATHLLGPMYSGIFIAAMIAQDLWARTFRPKLYLSALAAWPLLLLTYRNTIGTMALGKPKYWVPVPGLKDLAKAVAVDDRAVLLLLAALAAGVVLLRLRKRTVAAYDGVSRRPVYIALLMFAGTLLLVFAVSHVTTSIFFNRYLIPVVFGDMLLLCELARLVAAQLSWPLARKAMFATGCVLVMAAVVSRSLRPSALPTENFTADLLERAPAGVPLVITDYMLYAEEQFYQHDHATILMFVDWPIVLAPDFGPGGAAGPHEMDNWKQAGYWPDRILPTEELLARYPDFLIVDEPLHTSWFRHHIVEDPAYTVTSQPSFRGDQVWLVHKR